MELEKITETIIRCAYRVYNNVGFRAKKVEIKRKVKDLN